MTRRVISILMGTAVLILCGITAVQAGSGNTLFPDARVFPNPFHNHVASGRSAASVSTGAQLDAATIEESTCPVVTDHLAIVGAEGEGEGEGECGYEQAKLYLNGPNSLVVDSMGGGLTALGNGGALMLGFTGPGCQAPGAFLGAFAPDALPDAPPRAGLLACTSEDGYDSGVVVAAVDGQGTSTAYLTFFQPGDYDDGTMSLMKADDIAIAGHTAVEVSIDDVASLAMTRKVLGGEGEGEGEGETAGTAAINIYSASNPAVALASVTLEASKVGNETAGTIDMHASGLIKAYSATGGRMTLGDSNVLLEATEDDQGGKIEATHDGSVIIRLGTPPS